MVEANRNREDTAAAWSVGEKRFRALIENGTDGIALVGADAAILFVSPSNERLFGYSAAEIIHQNGLELVHPDDRAVEMTHWAKLFERPEEAVISECRVRHKDGSWRWAEIIRKNLLAEPEVQAIVVNYRDITERKRAEEALRESEERYRNLVELSPDMIAVHSEGRIRYINSAAAKLLDIRDPQELVGRSIFEFAHPEVRRVLAARLEEIYAAGEERNLIETRFARLDGKAIDVEVSSTRVTYQGQTARQVIVRDITERKRAEDALRVSEERFRSLYENATIGLYRTTPDGRILLSNPAIVHMLGYDSFLELAERNLERDGNDADYPRSHFREQIERDGEVKGKESAWKRKDGTTIFVRESAKAIRDAEGKVLYYEGTVEDITERKRAEEALRENEERLRVALATVNMAVFNQDRDLRYTWMYQPQLGYTTQQVVGKTDAELLPPEAAEKVGEVKRQVMATGIGTHEEVSVTWNEQTLHYDLVVEPLRNASDDVVGITGATLDITERKRAEEHLAYQARLLANVRDAIFATDAQFVLRSWNRASEELYGWKAEEVLGRRVGEVIRSEISDAETTEILRALNESGLYRHEVAQYRKDGALVYVEGTVIPLRDETGRITGYVTANRDISARKQAEEERARLFEQVRASRERLQVLSYQLIQAQEVERRRIARELHDEIGQVLTAVRTNLQAIQLSPDPSTLGPRLGESIGIIEGALRQVRDLSLDLRPSLLDDFGLAPALEWYVDRQAERSGFTAEFVADPPEMELSAVLETACFRVAQAALTNVARHARAKHVRVELRRTETELQLIVRDDGSGFDVAAVMERAAHGTSLGLLGMEERARLAGGQIEIESAPRRGTEIRARFPLAASAEDRIERRSEQRGT